MTQCTLLSHCCCRTLALCVPPSALPNNPNRCIESANSFHLSHSSCEHRRCFPSSSAASLSRAGSSHQRCTSWVSAVDHLKRPHGFPHRWSLRCSWKTANARSFVPIECRNSGTIMMVCIPFTEPSFSKKRICKKSSFPKSISSQGDLETIHIKPQTPWVKLTRSTLFNRIQQYPMYSKVLNFDDCSPWRWLHVPHGMLVAKLALKLHLE